LIIAVTGGQGVLGRAVTAMALTLGHRIVSIDRDATFPASPAPGVRHAVADLTSYESLAGTVDGAEAMVHLAAYVNPHAGPDHMVHNNNVVASYNALSVAAAAGISRVCLASSVNAIGGAYSRAPRYDYFPVDEMHPSYAEDPYSLSKWIAEQQGQAFARRESGMSVAALRLHALRERSVMNELLLRSAAGSSRRDLWGYTPLGVAAHACLAAITVPFDGYETFYVVAADTASDEPSMTLRNRHYPDVPVVGDLSGHRSFFDSSKAARILGIGAST
jgi:nucleoside-diphosphate-sugar epimerase